MRHFFFAVARHLLSNVGDRSEQSNGDER